MAGSVNKVILVGNLGRDPEVRTFQNGGRVASFSIATSESWKDKASGERRERTEWHRIAVMNDNLVTICERYVKKGSKVYIEGKLQTRKWQDQSGQDRYTTEVVVDGFSGTMQMLDSRSGGDTAFNQDAAPQQQAAPQQNFQSKQQAAPQTQAAPAGQPFEDEFDDDIPF